MVPREISLFCFPSSLNVSLDFVSVNNLYLLYDKGNCGV